MLGMDQHRHHHRRGAQVGHRMLGNGGVDRIWLDLAQAYVRATGQRHRPGMAPAVAVEHRQGPQVDAARPQLEDQRAGAGVEVGAAVMQDHALGIPRGAGGVVDGDRLPFVLRRTQRPPRVALGQKRLIVQVVSEVGSLGLIIVDAHQQGRRIEHGQRLLGHGTELTVADQHPGRAVAQDEGDAACLQANVDAYQHRPGTGYAIVGLEHFRDIRRQYRHPLARLYADPLQGTGQGATALVQLAVAVAPCAIDHRIALRVHLRGTLEERQRRQRDMVGFVGSKLVLKGRNHHGSHLIDTLLGSCTHIHTSCSCCYCARARYRLLHRWPPSTTISAPLMARPASLASSSKAPSRSAGTLKRRLGIRERNLSPASLARKASFRSVIT